MAKFYGSIVKTGRIGGSVFAVRNGVTIERQYQPMVANPSTEGQVAARARLKLMSQLSEALAPAIAFRRSGLVSPRNIFVKQNYSKSSFSNNAASIDYRQLDLTGGILAIPPTLITVGDDVLNLTLTQALTGFDRVVYTVYKVQGDELRFLGQKEAVAGTNNMFVDSITAGHVAGDSFVVYAYAVRFNSVAARASYESMIVQSATQTAIVSVLRNLLESDYTLSETVSDMATLQAN